MSLKGINLEFIHTERSLFSELNFVLNSGEILYISGPNGSGKTTLLRILAGLLAPTAGDIQWCGESILKQKINFQPYLAYLGHKTAIKLDLTVLENLQIANTITARLKELLIQFDLHRYQHVLAQKLSAGQRQRIALIRLLTAAAKLWILDEPLTALDQLAIEKLQLAMFSHLSNGGMIILTSHQPMSFARIKNIKLGGEVQL